MKKLTKILRATAIKKEEKRKYKKAIASRNPEQIRKTLYNYKEAQTNCIQIINEHEAKSIETNSNIKIRWNNFETIMEHCQKT